MSVYADNPNVRALPDGGYWVRFFYLVNPREGLLRREADGWRVHLRSGAWMACAPASATDDEAIASVLG